MKVIHLPWVKYLGAEAVTIWKWVFFASPNPSETLVNHERIHLDQIKRDGVFKFYFNYLSDYLCLRISGLDHKTAYENIPYEVEAYSNQDNLNYSIKGLRK